MERAQETTQLKRLLKASEEGDVARVRSLLRRRHVDINGTAEGGLTALHYASYFGHLEVTKLLLQAGADLHLATKAGSTALHHAASKGQSQVVELLLNVGADPHVTTQEGRTPLYSAATVKTVELLVKAGAHLDTTDENGSTPLHTAIKGHYHDVTRALLIAGANLHAKDNDGHEPLHLCIESNFPSLHETQQKMQVLVSWGATWDAKCDEMVATGKARREAAALGMCMPLWAQEHANAVAFSEIPREVLGRGAESTQTFIDEIQASRAIVLRRKICLVGSSCAGKTSLIKSITSQQPQLVHQDDRTIGIDHFPLRFQETPMGNENIKVHEVTFWDFAGQDAYQVAHSLFFSPRTLFLVCVDLEAFTTAFLQASIMADIKKQESQLMGEFIERTVMRWIRMIVARQPDAEFVFIATKADLVAENHATERLLKHELTVQLHQVASVVHEMKRQPVEDAGDREADVDQPQPAIWFVSCTSLASTRAARAKIEDVVIKSGYSFQMPDTYSKVLQAIQRMRADAKRQDITTRITRVFASVDSLPAKLNIEPALCRTILQTLHDLGDVLWYEDLGVELFRNTVILDPLLLIDFIRQIFNHKHTGQILSHADLKALPHWAALRDATQMEAMKQVLQAFHLVYSDSEDRVMDWDSDLIVPALWQTKTPAAWLFLGDILRLHATKSCAGEAVRVEWEYHFEYGLPPTLFDHVVVASVASYLKFDAGPDWILYTDGQVAACRIVVGRDVKSLHRTIHVEAVVAEAASSKQVEKLWRSFQRLCGAFVNVLHENPGLRVSSFAWDDDHTKINMKRLLRSNPPAEKWMPPSETWQWFKELMTGRD